jgi:hypothetical protein
MPVFSVVILAALIIFAWRNDSGFAYVMGAFLGIGTLFYIIGNGFVDEAPYALAGTVALVGIGYVRTRWPRRS